MTLLMQMVRARHIKRIVLWTVGGLVILLVGLWVAMLALLHATESHWLGGAPFHESIDVRSRRPHEITLIDDGAASLAERLRVIRNARQSLELEFFIYELDTASRIVTQALAEQARAGVKVRILVDMALPIFRLRPAFARELASAGIEVRYYNSASLVRFFAVHHRTHRKLLIADAETAILGGRNIADDYFDMSHRYNFLDTDIEVSGPVVKAIRESFELYWTSTWAIEPKDLPKEEVDTATDALAATILNPGDAERKTLELVSRINTDELPRSTCPDVHFVTDYPGSGVNHRRVFPAITATLQEARNEVLVESPYFVIRKDGADVIRQLTGRGVKLRILTNSLRSTDAWYTVSPLVPALNGLAMPNFELLAWRGEPLAGYGQWPNRSERWGVHAKRAVIDDNISLIGTYNIDPRSANFNSELMLVCRGDPALAAAVRSDWLRRASQADHLIEGNESHGVSALVRNADGKSVMLTILGIPLSRMFDFLL